MDELIDGTSSAGAHRLPSSVALVQCIAILTTTPARSPSSVFVTRDARLYEHIARIPSVDGFRVVTSLGVLTDTERLTPADDFRRGPRRLKL